MTFWNAVAGIRSDTELSRPCNMFHLGESYTGTSAEQVTLLSAHVLSREGFSISAADSYLERDTMPGKLFRLVYVNFCFLFFFWLSDSVGRLVWMEGFFNWQQCR